MRVLLLGSLLAVLAACGGAQQQDNCSDQPPASAQNGQFVTQAGCPFEQQLDNILHFGKSLTPTALHDGTGVAQATLTAQCGEWLQGKDAQGVVVVVSTATGEVRSHGRMHAGMPTSALPESLALPLSH